MSSKLTHPSSASPNRSLSISSRPVSRCSWSRLASLACPRVVPVAAALLLLSSTGGFAAAIPGAATDSSLAPEGWHKADSFAGRLLLPYFQVDTLDGAGTTTLFAVRNESGNPVDISFEYYETDVPQTPQRTEMLTLQGKEIRTVNIRLVPDLEVDEVGVKEGYVIVNGPQDALLQGDYYQVTPNQDFATGFQLLDIDTTSSQNDLCNLFSMRFLNGGGFDSGTEYLVWLDLPMAPGVEQPVLDIFAYTQEGGDPILGREFFADTVAFKVSAEELLQPLSQDFGAIEFQFRNGVVGHVSAVQSAANRYSVGLEAACGDL